MHAEGETLSIAELVELGAWVENQLAAKTRLRLIYSHPVAFKPLNRIFGERGDSCSICGIFGIIGVLASGSYALCGIGESVPELIFGHASSDQLKAVWENNPVLNEIRNGLPKLLKGVCGDCLMNSRCLGSCVAQNYYRSQDLLAPFWYCEAAMKEGLFPKSRTRLAQNAA